MDQKFQTSFIPKRPVIGMGGSMQMSHKQGGAGVSIFMTLAVLLFIASLAGVGGAYFWKQYLISAQDGFKQSLTAKGKEFNVDQIAHLKEVNNQIDMARQLLKNHVASSQIFNIVSKFTIEGVRFLSLDLKAPSDQSSNLSISMKGYGTNLSAVAFQSDVFGSLEQYGLNSVVKNPIVSDPSLDPAGVVTFGFTADINPSSLMYENSVTGTSTSNQ